MSSQCELIERLNKYTRDWDWTIQKDEKVSLGTLRVEDKYFHTIIRKPKVETELTLCCAHLDALSYCIQLFLKKEKIA